MTNSSAIIIVKNNQGNAGNSSRVIIITNESNRLPRTAMSNNDEMKGLQNAPGNLAICLY